MTATEVMIGGVKVSFPNKPYPSQFSMMSKIIKGLQKSENCLLESPTGSGKTLSLLCSVIAWQQAERANQIKLINEDSQMRIQKIREACYCDCKSKPSRKRLEIEYEDEATSSSYFEQSNDSIENSCDDKESSKNNRIGDCACICHGMYGNDLLDTVSDLEIKKAKKIPKIYFATRTHKQIANVIKEFKKTSYGKATRMTILASRNQTCIHPEVSKSSKKDDNCRKLVNPKKTQSIEGITNSHCSFQQNLKKNPIAYENFGFKNVWDIEELVKSFKRKRLCPYYASKELVDLVDIIFCPYNYLIDPRIRKSMQINLDEEIVIVDEAHNVEDSCRESTTSLITKLQLETSIRELKELLSLTVLTDEMRRAAVFFVGVFENLLDWIDSNTTQMEQRDFDASLSRIFTGIEMCSEFKTKIGLGPERIEEFETHINKLFAEPDKEDPAPIEVPEGIKMLAEHLFLALDFLYMKDHEYMEDFKVAIIRTKVDELPQPDGEDSRQPLMSQFSNARQKNKFTYVIHFWCMNPAVAFHYLKNCHSIILCSGTLSPMDTFQSELGVKFEHTLEANHVISDKQVWVGCLGSGPTGASLLSTYKFTEQYAYQDEIGRLVLDVCKTIPYGVLIFLPSYSLLTKLMTRWNQTNMNEKISDYKEIFSETRVAKGFDTMLKNYYDCIDNSSGGEFHNGALMLAVYRGRASEGLDFSDNYARAVIAVGIPYPSIKDTQVDLKRKYNNALCRQKNLLNGDEWYEIQAYRAVNQGLGRCIRHRKDWGAIILVDDRYFKNPQKYMKGISKWIRSKYKTYSNYNKAISSLKDFNENLKNYDRDAATTSQCEQSQVQVGLSQTQSNLSFALESQKENSPQDVSEQSYIPHKNPVAIKLDKFEFKNNKTQLSTQDLVDLKTPLKTSTQNFKKTLDSGHNDFQSTPIMGSSSKKRKSNLEIDETDSPDLAAKRQFFNNFKKTKKVTKKEIQYIDDDDDEINKHLNESEDIMIIDSSPVDRNKPKVDSNSKQSNGNNENKTPFKEFNQKQVSSKKSKQCTNKEEVDETASLIIPPSPENLEHDLLKFECIHCNKFICDFSYTTVKSEDFFQHFNELPDELTSHIYDMGLQQLSLLSNEIDRISFESNTRIKSFTFFMSNSSMKLTQNSFFDESRKNCWQYFECLGCLKIVGFVLKSIGISEQPNFEKYLNQIILIKDFTMEAS